VGDGQFCMGSMCGDFLRNTGVLSWSGGMGRNASWGFWADVLGEGKKA